MCDLKYGAKKHIYKINDLHRTATNRWQKNLNSNKGKKFVTLLGKTREKRRLREGESKLDRCSGKGTEEEKGIPHPGKSPIGGRSNELEESPDAEKRVAVSLSTEKQM